ncbi:hypothetical protein G6F56_010765 [Rhizopus delemar]|nr:hypothetical protein G6F56_010765 [Rhizopus delemar]
MGMKQKSPYEVLGVGRYSSQKEIRMRYLELCKQYHPDVCKIKDATQRFTDIKYAYEILTHKTVAQPLISRRPTTTVIDTQMWTRRSMFGGIGLMVFVFWYVSGNNENRISYTSQPITATTQTPWQKSGMSYRQWRQQ